MNELPILGQAPVEEYDDFADDSDRRLRRSHRFEINATHACNAVCKWCNRLVGVVDVPDSDVTPRQIDKMVDVMKRTHFRTHRVKISGGEPAENPHLPEIIWKVSEKITSNILVLTNGTEPERRKAIKLPEGAKWIRSPLDRKRHDPFLISPMDLGFRSTLPLNKKCETMSRCGTVFDYGGFAMCGVASTLGRVLRVDPYSDKPVLDRTADICNHCIYSLPWDVQEKVHQLVYEKKITNPSPTFRKMLRIFREKPFLFARYGTRKFKQVLGRKLLRKVAR